MFILLYKSIYTKVFSVFKSRFYIKLVLSNLTYLKHYRCKILVRINSKYINEMVAPLCDSVQNIKINKEEDQASTKVDTELDNIRYTDLYVIGKIWINALRAGLIGENFNLFPVVKAAKADDTPKKPPYMRYQDLSLYQSPHCAYKEYTGDQIKCPDAKVKLLHQSLLPHVKNGRQMFNKALCKVTCFIKCQLRCAGENITKSKNDFKQTMRAPDNLAVRQAVVAAGGIAGYMIGGGGGVPRRLFYTSAGLLSTGALCFPKETDETFRNATYVVAKNFIALYNKWCGKGFSLREKLACKDELPPPPPKRQPLKCPPK